MTISVENVDDLATTLRSNGIPGEHPVLVLVGGAGGLGEVSLAAIRAFVTEQLCPALDRWDAVAVDGGTDSGVMRVLGHARREVRARFPLVGVTAIGTVLAEPATGEHDGAAPLEPNHTHAVLVPGDQWGDETPWIVAVATAIAGSKPSATMLINGGRVALQDCAASIAAARPMVVLQGSGRAADDVAAASDGGGSADAAAVAASPLTTVVPLDDPSAVIDELNRLLT